MKKIGKKNCNLKMPKWATGAFTSSVVAAGTFLNTSGAQAQSEAPKKKY